jgi:hypothetical protein
MRTATLILRAPRREIVVNQQVRGCSVRRYYDPGTGQFISVDAAVDQTEQPYSYAAGDPIDNVDPSGLGVCAFGVCVPTPSLQNVSDYVAGFGDEFTFGGTRDVRNWINGELGLPNAVNYCSLSYMAGTGLGVVAQFEVGDALVLPLLRNAAWLAARGIDVVKVTNIFSKAYEYSEAGGAGKPGFWRALDAARGALKGAGIDFSSLANLRKSLGLPVRGGRWPGWPG